ncbi:MAG: hypothetical protein JOY56_00075 [Solirubrobacterales bacterium]|nr:hypothetical protein [Solirubrobacterales bacterium]
MIVIGDGFAGVTAAGEAALRGPIANRWAGFIDGAIESGLRAGARTAALAG